MATKAELLEQAQTQGLDVNTKTTKADLESMLSSDSSDSASGSDNSDNQGPVTDDNATLEDRTGDSTNEEDAAKIRENAGGADDSTTGTLDGATADESPERSAETVEVNANEGGEATNGTTEEGNEGEVQNDQSIPQNGVDEVETTAEQTPTLDPNTTGDEARTEEEIAFADESNPNQKSRRTADGGGEFDQDGNPRTGGKSYGVSENNQDVEQDVFLSNRGTEPEQAEIVAAGQWLNPEAGSEDDTNNSEWDEEDIRKLEESLSEPENNIKAVVSTSTGRYVRVKFFRNNLAFGTYKSRDFSEDKAREYLADLKESRGL